jgi:hypothetical protein
MRKYPNELARGLGGGDGGKRSFELRSLSDNTVISPEYGCPSRQELLSGDLGCDDLVLTFNVSLHSNDLQLGIATEV